MRTFFTAPFAFALAFQLAEAQQSVAPLPPVPTVPVKSGGDSAARDAGSSSAPTPAKPTETATHTIQAGDNPWKIAQKYGVKLDELLKLNAIKDPKNLAIGDVLKLPATPAGTPATKPSPASEEARPDAAESAAAPTPAPKEGDGWDLYTIKKGDNPWKIAKALKVEHQKIVSLNEGLDFTKLDIGQQIRVPKKNP